MKYYVFNSSIVMYMYIVDTNQTKVMLFKEFEKVTVKVLQKLYFVQKYRYHTPKRSLGKYIFSAKELSLNTLINTYQNKHNINTENVKKFIRSWEIYLFHQICCMKTFTSTIYTQEAS